MEFITKSTEETKDLGKRIASELNPKDKAAILALEGDLGSGKTTFVQGFAEGLGIVERILSPTFILVRQYPLRNNIYENFYHIDLYRLEENIKEQIEDLGILELFFDPKNVIAVEWADKAKDIFPEETAWMKFFYDNDNRKIYLNR